MIINHNMATAPLGHDRSLAKGNPLRKGDLAKRLLQFAELPQPERTLAYKAWLNSAGSPKRNAARQAGFGNSTA